MGRNRGGRGERREPVDPPLLPVMQQLEARRRRRRAEKVVGRSRAMVGVLGGEEDGQHCKQ
jgi:hypothetical protein